jgi:hypothetical protein
VSFFATQWPHSSGIFARHNYQTAKNERFCGSRHSDKEKFRSDLNRPKSCEMSERLLKTLRNSGDFQAEYEGSIPFTRSSAFNGSSCQEVSILTSRAFSF